MPEIDDLKKQVAELEAAIDEIRTVAWDIHQRGSVIETQITERDDIQPDTMNVISQAAAIIAAVDRVKPN